MSNINYTVDITQLIETVEEMEPIPFIWSGIKEGSFGYIFGPAKSGKTIFCESLALSLATNQKEFLGLELPIEEKQVLFISMEEYFQPRTERNAMQIDGMKLGKNQKVNLKVVGDNFPRFFASNNDWEILRDAIVESQANIIFIDSLTRLSDGDIEQSNYSRKVSRQLRELTYELGITMIVVHHTPKLEGKPITQDSIAGSRVLAQEADFSIGINKTLYGKRYIKEVFFRYKQEESDIVLSFKINKNSWIEALRHESELQLLKEPDMRKDSTNEDYLKMAIVQSVKSSGNPVFKSGEIEKLVEGEMDRSTFYDKMKVLQLKGDVTKTGKGNYQFNRISHT